MVADYIVNELDKETDGFLRPSRWSAVHVANCGDLRAERVMIINESAGSGGDASILFSPAKDQDRS